MGIRSGCCASGPILRFIVSGAFPRDLLAGDPRIHLRDLGDESVRLRAAKVGLVLFCLALIPVAMQGGLVRLLAPRLGEVRLATFAILSYVLGFVIVGYSSHLPLALVGLACCGVGSGLFNPSASALASKQATARDRGAVMGTYQSGLSLARAPDSLRLRRALRGGRAECALSRGCVPHLAGSVAHLEFATCLAHDCVLMKERSTLQPFSPGDVFVGSTVLDGADDDHAGRGRILQYDAQLRKKARSGSRRRATSWADCGSTGRGGYGRSTRRRSSCSRWIATGR